MSDLFSTGQRIGNALFGASARAQKAYDDTVDRGTQRAAALARAQIERDTYLQRMQQPEALATTLGITPEQAGALSTLLRSDVNVQQLGQFRESQQAQGFRQDAVTAALAGDPTRANAYLTGLADNPITLTQVAGGSAFNPTALPDGQSFTTTPLGGAQVEATMARGRAADALAGQRARAPAPRAPVAREPKQSSQQIIAQGEYMIRQGRGTRGQIAQFLRGKGYYSEAAKIEAAGSPSGSP